MNLAGICIVTKNVNRLVEFYKKILKAESEGDDIHSEIKTDGAGLAILSENGMEDLAPGSMAGAGVGNITIMIKADDIDAEYERIKSLGVVFVKDLKTHPWGASSFWFRDPDGNILDFMSTPE